jgi:hypothetical protein
MLCELVTEMAAIKYDLRRKEEMMYKVIKIDGLLTELLTDINTESAVKMLEQHKEQTEVAKMNEIEQKALFTLYRNVFADFSHYLSDAELKQHIEGFALLCNGITRPADIAVAKSNLTHMTRTPKLKQILSKEDAGLQRTTRLLCQIGYYLLKARELASSCSLYGAFMALISAGNCARFFHLSGANIGKPVRITEHFTDLRRELAHATFAHLNAEQIMTAIEARFKKIDDYISTLQTEVKDLGININ